MGEELSYKQVSKFQSEIYNSENEHTGLETEGIETGGTSARSTGGSEESRLDWVGEKCSWFQIFNLTFMIMYSMKTNIQDWELKVLRQVGQVEDLLEAQKNLD